jgi:amino acid permease
MLAENVSLGVLALPQALAILGLVPGLLCICFLGIIATYTGYLIGEFKLAHPSVANYADCGMLMSGPVLREVLAVGQLLVLIFIMGAHILTFAVAMNAMTDHGTCTIVFTVVGLIVSFLLGLPRNTPVPASERAQYAISTTWKQPDLASGKPDKSALWRQLA